MTNTLSAEKTERKLNGSSTSYVTQQILPLIMSNTCITNEEVLSVFVHSLHRQLFNLYQKRKLWFSNEWWFTIVCYCRNEMSSLILSSCVAYRVNGCNPLHSQCHPSILLVKKPLLFLIKPQDINSASYEWNQKTNLHACVKAHRFLFLS